MKRRTVLKRASAVTGSLAVAGCLSDGTGNGDGSTTDEGDGGESTTEDPTGTEPGTTEAAMSLGDRSLETVSTGCGTENTAEVAFGDSGASVDGKIPASDPCHEAKFVNVELNDGALTMTLEAVETDADSCQQCLGMVEYSAGIGTENGVPKSVTVTHEAQGETTVVAESTR
ncbi:hypothetical protein [Halorubellus sp. PRR65]|uniref:hypothetical protein n=1 Tax=Halorubellus sp. PRR65 TaxID=3098148 RepID=UPI002B26238E|nr:hypothetical protein [Halorubellus sp. PRR65]